MSISFKVESNSVNRSLQEADLLAIARMMIVMELVIKSGLCTIVNAVDSRWRNSVLGL